MSSTYNPGDVCRVRGWDDMVDEYGVEEGEIQCPGTFIEAMRPLCGMQFTVKKVERGRYYSEERVEFINAAHSFSGTWVIRAEMLEPFVEEAPISPVSIPGW